MATFNKLWQPTADTTNTILVACSAAAALTASINTFSGMPICPIIADKFNNGEIRVKLRENVRNKHAFIVCTMRTLYINDDCMELFLVIDACNRADVDKVTVILPYFPYGRSDKKDEPRVPIAASIITQFLQTLRVSNVISVDLHAAQLQALMPKGFHNLYIKNMMCQAFIDAGILVAPGTDIATANNANYVFVAPDAGSIKRTEAYAAAFGMNYIILHKQRDYTRPGVVKRSMIIADSPELYHGKTAIIIDDIGDTMGTMIAAINELCSTHSQGCKDAIIGLTHGVFSAATDGVTAFCKIDNCAHIKKVFVTNSLSFTLPQNTTMPQKITVIDIAPLLACTIDGIITGKSVSQLL